MTKDNLLTEEEFEELIEMAKSKNEYSFCFVSNPILGRIVLPHGERDSDKKVGYGYEHIVYGRATKDNLKVDCIAGLLIRTLEILKSATEENISKTLKNKRKVVEEKDIKIVLSQKKIFNDNIWVITSYPLFEKGQNKIKKETLDFLSTVNATEEYAQYYSYFRDIVGALVSSINITKNKQIVNGG